MNETLFFYDLETTSFNPREGRIVQFGGQRTNLNLDLVGEPTNVLIKLTDDIVPDPDAVMVTGITPQQTVNDGITEEEFMKFFNKEINIPGTTFVGFNNVRFDDEFMRFLQYRNLYEPYTWQWSEGRSRWDILDLVRMTRALRPDGIIWPVDKDNKPTNRLELLSSLNKLSHDKAHDALSDVLATIDVAKLLKEKQPKLFNYLYQIRDKKKVAEFVGSNEVFIYTSGKYSSEYEKTSIVEVVTTHPTRQGALVYDLRVDPTPFAKMDAKELAVAWQLRRDEPGDKLPVKTILYNRCPAVAPLAVLDKESQKRLKIDMKKIEVNRKTLKAVKDFPAKLLEAQKILDAKRDSSTKKQPEQKVDAKLYDGFFNSVNNQQIHKIHDGDPSDLADMHVPLGDKRLDELFPLFVARNYPQVMSIGQREIWDKHRKDALLSGGTNSRLSKYFNRLSELAEDPKLSSEKRYLIEELQLWGESIIPTA